MVKAFLIDNNLKGLNKSHKKSYVIKSIHKKSNETFITFIERVHPVLIA